MILMDYSQVMLATLFVNIGNHINVELDENLLRRMFLMSLRANRAKFSDDYGEMVICCDSTNSWRRDLFPYYKAGRRSGREKSEIDWNHLYEVMGKIRDEMNENFPYKVLQVDRCEADDIIAVICQEHGVQLNTGAEKILVLSGDKDYIQLQRYANVDQYDPVRKKFVRHDNPDQYLIEHVLRGDKGDGVPNILSPDNCFVKGIRQKAMTKSRLALYSGTTENMDEETLRRYKRNQSVIDLDYIPQEYKDKIIEDYNVEKTVGRSKLFKYFAKYRLKNLLTDIQDF